MNERRELIPTQDVEGFSGEIGMMMVEALEEVSISYASENGLGEDLQEGIDLAKPVVGEIFRQEMGDEPLEKMISLFGGLNSYGKVERKVRKVIKAGSQKRKEQVVGFNTFLRSVNKTDLYHLGIEAQHLSEAWDEMRVEAITPTLEKNRYLQNEVENKKLWVEEISTRYLQDLLDPSIYDRDDVKRFLIFPDSQGMLMRGVVMSMTATLVSHECDPLFMLPDDFEAVLLAKDSLPIDYDFFSEMGQELGKYLDFSDEEVESVGRVFAGYGMQVMERLGYWQKSSVERNRDKDDPKYWRKFEGHFKTFPIAPFLPDVQFVISPENIVRAENSGLPHLWKSGVEIDGWMIPSAQDVVRGIKILQIEERHHEIAKGFRLLQAESAWKSYIKILGYNPKRINQLEEKIEALQDVAGDDLDMEMDPTLPLRIEILSRNIHSSKREINYLQKKRERDEEYREILNDTSFEDFDVSSESSLSAFLRTTRLRLKSKKSSLIQSRGQRNKYLSGYGWHRLTREGVYGGGVYDTRHGVKLEIDRVESLLNDASNNEVGLPEFMMINPRRAVDFLNEWRSSGTRRNVVIKNSTFIFEARAQRAALVLSSSNPNFHALTEWYQGDMGGYLSRLYKQQNTLINLERTEAELRDIETVLEGDGEERINAWDRLKSGFVKERWDDEIDKMRMMALPDDIRNELSILWSQPHIMREVEELVNLYGRRHGNRKMTLEGVENLQDEIDAQMSKKKMSESFKLFLDKLWEYQENPMLPWSFKSKKSIQSFMNSLSFRIQVARSYLYLPVYKANLDKRIAEREVYMKVVQKVEAKDTVRKLTKRMESFGEEMENAESTLLSTMKELRFAVSMDWFDLI